MFCRGQAYSLFSLGLAFVLATELHADESLRVRVMSFNIHHGEGVDGKFDLPRIAAVIRQAEPDVVALQEVDKKTKRASGVDQPSELAQLTGMTVIFERNIEYQGGDYGNAVLSRWKVRRHVNHALPSFYVGEQRGVLDLEVEAPGEKVIRFLATHLDYRPADGERLASVEMISKLLASAEARQLPTILAGDLNALPDSAVMQKFREQWTVASGSAATPTYPAPMPTRQLDYVLAYPSTDWKLVEFRVLEERVASDHRPVLAIWEYRK